MTTKEKTKAPIIFWIIVIILLLWNIMGVYSFFYHVFISDETLRSLPANERELYSQYPLWINITFGIAVLGGMLGSIGLLLRKGWAKPFALLSLIAVIIQMFHNVFMIDTLKVYGKNAYIMPLLVVLVALFLVLFIFYSIKKNWISKCK